jgi:hypothetical protein
MLLMYLSMLFIVSFKMGMQCFSRLEKAYNLTLC